MFGGSTPGSARLRTCMRIHFLVSLERQYINQWPSAMSIKTEEKGFEFLVTQSTWVLHEIENVQRQNCAKLLMVSCSNV